MVVGDARWCGVFEGRERERYDMSRGVNEREDRLEDWLGRYCCYRDMRCCDE